MALVAFDFDKKLTEDQNTIGLVPKETKDDKIDFLKQFQEYWEFEKAFKYNSTFDTTFNKVISQTGLDRDQANEILEDLIGIIVGKAAEKIGLKWQMINDENYLFGFYKADGPSNLPVVLVPHKFKFSQVKEKLLDWLIAQKKNQHKKPKMQVVESLSRRVAQQNQRKDAIDTVSGIDEEVAIKMMEKFLTSTWSGFEYPSSQMGSFDLDRFVSKYERDYFWLHPERNMFIVKLISHVEYFEQDYIDRNDLVSIYNPDRTEVLCLNIVFEDSMVKLGWTYPGSIPATYKPCTMLTPRQAQCIIGGDGVTNTGNTMDSLMSVISFVSDQWEILEENVFDYSGLIEYLNSDICIDDAKRARAAAEGRLLEFFKKNREEIINDYKDDLFND